MSATLRVASTLAKVPMARLVAARALHCSAVRGCISRLAMPIPYPDMEEGDIATWKMKEGDIFHVGDVLLEIETEKTVVDVEAQRDGIVGKIIVPDGFKHVRAGRVIALLADEGDDISRLEAPAQSFFPSVRRLLATHAISSSVAAEIPGSGVRGMLTKGDVLAYIRAQEVEAAQADEERALAVIDTPVVEAGALVLPSWLLAALKARVLAASMLSPATLFYRLLAQARQYWPPQFPTNPPAAFFS